MFSPAPNKKRSFYTITLSQIQGTLGARLFRHYADHFKITLYTQRLSVENEFKTAKTPTTLQAVADKQNVTGEEKATGTRTQDVSHTVRALRQPSRLATRLTCDNVPLLNLRCVQKCECSIGLALGSKLHSWTIVRARPVFSFYFSNF